MAVLLACALATGGCVSAPAPKAPGIAIFTSLPIVWPEQLDFRGLINRDVPPHWALAILQRHGKLQPLDILAKANGRAAMVPNDNSASVVPMTEAVPRST